MTDEFSHTLVEFLFHFSINMYTHYFDKEFLELSAKVNCRVFIYQHVYCMQQFNLLIMIRGADFAFSERCKFLIEACMAKV